MIYAGCSRAFEFRLLYCIQEGGIALRLKGLKPWLFVFPALLIYLAVLFVPTLYSLYLSFFRWNGVSAEKAFVGLQNYKDLLFNDTVFSKALSNNITWTIWSLIIIIGFGLMLALLLNKGIKGKVFFRSIFYFPYVLSGVIVATIWTWIYNPTQGIVNKFLELVGLESLTHTWLADPKTALIAVFVAAVWQGVGQPFVLFLAGLQTIPSDPYEAALIDGASTLQRFRYLTIPLLSETFIIVFAITTVNSMKVYDIIYSMTAGGPAQSTHVLSTWMYYQTFKFSNVGLGSAISMILVLITMIIIIPYVIYTTKKSDA